MCAKNPEKPQRLGSVGGVFSLFWLLSIPVSTPIFGVDSIFKMGGQSGIFIFPKKPKIGFFGKCTGGKVVGYIFLRLSGVFFPFGRRGKFLPFLEEKSPPRKGFFPTKKSEIFWSEKGRLNRNFPAFGRKGGFLSPNFMGGHSGVFLPQSPPLLFGQKIGFKPLFWPKMGVETGVSLFFEGFRGFGYFTPVSTPTFWPKGQKVGGHSGVFWQKYPSAF